MAVQIGLFVLGDLARFGDMFYLVQGFTEKPGNCVRTQLLGLGNLSLCVKA